MSVLANLPSVIFANIVKEFLSEERFPVELDSAFCNRVLRPVYLREVSQLSCDEDFPFRFDDHPTMECYQWAIARSMKVNHCFLNEDSLMGGLAFEVNLQSLTLLSIEASPNSLPAYVDIINSCKSLRHLHLFGFHTLKGIDGAVLRDLTKLDVQGRCEASVIETIARECRMLEAFLYDEIATSAQVVAVLTNNPNLRCINCIADLDVLDHIVQHCPKLSDIRLRSRGNFTVSSATKKLRQAPGTVFELKGQNCNVLYDPLEQVLEIALYDNTNNDLEDFMAEVKNVNHFEVKVPFLLTDTMTASCIANNRHTLEQFFCNVGQVSTSSLRRLLVECKSLRCMRLVTAPDDIATLADVMVGVEKMDIGLREISSSDVATMLTSCSKLVYFNIGIITHFDIPIEVVKECVVNHNVDCGGAFSCSLGYDVGFGLMSIKFKNGAFELPQFSAL